MVYQKVPAKAKPQLVPILTQSFGTLFEYQGSQLNKYFKIRLISSI